MVTYYGMVTYYITAVEIETVKGYSFVSRVFIHYKEGDIVHMGEIKTKDEVIAMLEDNLIYTATWGYAGARWQKGQAVTSEQRDKQAFLRTTLDNQFTDNLFRLLPLANMGL